MVNRRTVLKSGIAVGSASLVGLSVTGTATAQSLESTGDDESIKLLVNAFDSSAYPVTNELSEWSEHVAFDDNVSNGTLRLEYDDGGFLASNVFEDVSAYDRLELAVRGDDGGEEDDIDFRIGTDRDQLSNLTDDSIGTSFSALTVDLVERPDGRDLPRRGRDGHGSPRRPARRPGPAQPDVELTRIRRVAI